MRVGEGVGREASEVWANIVALFASCYLLKEHTEISGEGVGLGQQS